MQRKNNPIEIKTILKPMLDRISARLVLASAEFIESYLAICKSVSLGPRFPQKYNTLSLLKDNGIIKNHKTSDKTYCLALQYANSGITLGFATFKINNNSAEIISILTNKRFDQGSGIRILLFTEIAEQLKKLGYVKISIRDSIFDEDKNYRHKINACHIKKINNSQFEYDTNTNNKLVACLQPIFKKDTPLASDPTSEAVELNSLDNLNLINKPKIGVSHDLTKEFSILDTLNLHLIAPTSGQLSVIDLYIDHAILDCYTEALVKNQNPYLVNTVKCFILALQDKTSAEIVAAAFYWYSESSKDAELDSLVVSSNYRKSHYGSLLLSAVLKHLTQLGCLNLSTEPSCEGLPLYLKFSFFLTSLIKSSVETESDENEMSKSIWDSISFEKRLSYLESIDDWGLSVFLNDAIIQNQLLQRKKHVEETIRKDLIKQQRPRAFSLFSLESNLGDKRSVKEIEKRVRRLTF